MLLRCRYRGWRRRWIEYNGHPLNAVHPHPKSVELVFAVQDCAHRATASAFGIEDRIHEPVIESRRSSSRTTGSLLGCCCCRRRLRSHSVGRRPRRCLQRCSETEDADITVPVVSGIDMTGDKTWNVVGVIRCFNVGALQRRRRRLQRRGWQPLHLYVEDALVGCRCTAAVPSVTHHDV